MMTSSQFKTNREESLNVFGHEKSQLVKITSIISHYFNDGIELT